MARRSALAAALLLPLLAAAGLGATQDLSTPRRAAVREHLVRVLQSLDGGRHLPHTRIEGDARARPQAGTAPADGSRSSANGAAHLPERRDG